jgi:hypothetical protein
VIGYPNNLLPNQPIFSFITDKTSGIISLLNISSNLTSDFKDFIIGVVPYFNPQLANSSQYQITQGLSNGIQTLSNGNNNNNVKPPMVSVK